MGWRVKLRPCGKQGRRKNVCQSVSDALKSYVRVATTPRPAPLDTIFHRMIGLSAAIFLDISATCEHSRTVTRICD